MDFLRDSLRCPRCLGDIAASGASWKCTTSECAYSRDGFPTAKGQPVLIDFDCSVFSRDAYRDDDSGSVSQRRAGKASGRNRVAHEKCQKILRLAKERHGPHPIVLVIGGGTIGSGSDSLYEDPDVRLIGTDVYASAYTQVVADGHHLPFADESFDCVWIQAVLEHVLEPQAVVDEIYRVLRPGGLVYSDTPFMQQVHEGAYDFMRFTLSGHRWLYRRFVQIDAGITAGACVATLWSVRYLARAFGAGYKLSRLAASLFFWLRFFDRFTRPRPNADAASATFFLGSKGTKSLAPKDMVAYYRASFDVPKK